LAVPKIVPLKEGAWFASTVAPALGKALTKKLNSVALVRERTIPTERPPLVGEVSANLCG
jgi:hypothetical protein